MIYEKRNTNIIIKRDDMPVKDVGAVGEKMHTAMPQRIVARPVMNNAVKPLRFAAKTHRARMGVKGAVLVAAMLVFCIFAVDSRLFGGRLKSGIAYAAINGVKYTLENVVEETAFGSSTLYARLLSDRSDELFVNQTEDVQKPNTSVTEVPEKPVQTVTVANNTSKSFVDGEVFYPITKLDLSADSVYSLTNATSFSPNLNQLSKTPPKALRDLEITDSPLVLIVHTHGEECYTEYTDMYPESEETRSGDTEKNVIRVGKEIKDTLSDFGINAVHCTKMHDSESFINAYSGSASSVRQYLEQYPSIKIVVDVHRDAIIRDDGESIKAAVEIAGQEYAQIMFVVGTNELGHNHPNWQDNLSLALTLQQSIDSTYPSLCRSINLRDVPFNQQLSSGYLLLEVGTCANTLDEALRSARAFGENLARTLVVAQ